MKHVFLPLFVLAALCGVANGEVFLDTGFEGTSSLPAGWTQSQISGNATWAIQQGGQTGGNNPSSAHSGSNNATLYATNTNQNKTQLISPSFNTDGYTNLSLTFWHTQALWSPDQDELKVFYSSNGGSIWTELAYYTNSVSAWTQRTVEIPTAGINSRIAFEGNAKYGFGVCLDDIQVTGIPSNISEVSVSATDATASEAGQEPGTWTITRVGNTTVALSVHYTLGGTALAGSDYTVSPASPVTFAAAETSKVVTLTPVDDSVAAEGDEVATLTLTAGAGYVIDQATADISIQDDEGFDLNILVIGSTHSFSEGGEHDVVHEKPFNPTTIATHLKSILSQDPLLSDTVNVEFEDVYKSKTNTVRTSSTGIDDITAHCYSLAQHFMWPDGKATRLANFRGEAGTQWDYIVLCSDPYIMANFPGMYAEGVKLIQDEVARSANPAQVILMAQWPENSSSFSAGDFNEIMHRVGSSSGLTVVPAGKAWDSYASQDTNSAHPTPRGEYLAAAAIYSKLYNRSAKTSGYSYPSEGTNIADHAHSVVQANAGVAQYSGTYTSINPFQMKYVHKRDYNYRETGTSTEDRLALALDRLDDVARITMLQNLGSFWDFNYGRGNDRWEDDKDYEVNPAKYDRAYGFPMHHYYLTDARYTMPYGIDKYYFSGEYEDGTDLGIAYNMIRPNTRELSLPADVRAIPIRLLWLKMEQAYPGFNPLGDDTHMHPHLNDASAAFMYTLLSGRCPVVNEPAPRGSTAWMQWLGHKIGYETAWQMSHLTTRSPGFQVLPSSRDAKTITTTTNETMTVRFVNPPQANVTVNVSTSNTAFATVSPAILTFTPSNYSTPQQVTVSGVAAEQGLQNINVLFSTSSNDEIYHNLSDSWTYSSNTDSVSYGQTVLLAGFDGTNTQNTTSSTAGVYKELSVPKRSSTSAANVNATLSTTDAVVNGLQWGGMTSPSTWGSIIFTPNATTTNNLLFAADNAATVSFLIQNTGSNEVTVEKLHFRLQRDNATGGSANQVTIALASGDLTASGTGVQALSGSTGAFNYDFNLSSILTDATLGPGESATFTFTAVPTDPAGTGRRIRVDNMAISGTVNPPNNFADWIGGFEVGSQSAFSDDFDKDGLKNGIESWFGTHPGEFTAGVLPAVMDTDANTFTFTHPIGENPPDDVNASYRWSKDLTHFYYSGQSDPDDTTVTFTQGTPFNGRASVTATITGTGTDRIFVDIEVTRD